MRRMRGQKDLQLIENGKGKLIFFMFYYQVMDNLGIEKNHEVYLILMQK